MRGGSEQEPEAVREQETLEPQTYVRRPVGEAPAEVVPRGGAPSRFPGLNREAIDALEAGELERAVELFEECVEGEPDEPVFQRNLAEALARLAVRDRGEQSPCGHCVETLARAAELAPDREDLTRLLDRWRREAELEEGFWRESSQHFDLAFDGRRDQILWGSHKVLEELEAAYTDFAEIFGFHPVEAGKPRISVVLYRREGFDALTGLGDWAGGAFDGTVRLPVEDEDLDGRPLKRVLRHELVHAFIHAAGGTDVPGWLNEGPGPVARGRPPAGRPARPARADGTGAVPARAAGRDPGEVAGPGADPAGVLAVAGLHGSPGPAVRRARAVPDGGGVRPGGEPGGDVPAVDERSPGAGVERSGAGAGGVGGCGAWRRPVPEPAPVPEPGRPQGLAVAEGAVSRSRLRSSLAVSFGGGSRGLAGSGSGTGSGTGRRLTAPEALRAARFDPGKLPPRLRCLPPCKQAAVSGARPLGSPGSVRITHRSEQGAGPAPRDRGSTREEVRPNASPGSSDSSCRTGRRARSP